MNSIHPLHVLAALFALGCALLAFTAIRAAALVPGPGGGAAHSVTRVIPEGTGDEVITLPGAR